MNILIIGAGAIGSLVAWRLGVAGHQVTAVGRASYVQAVRQRGLLVEQDGQMTEATGLRAVATTEELRDARFDLVLITTKAFDTAVSAVLAQPFVRHGARVVVLQNGVGGVDIARAILGDTHLYAGVITIPVEVPEPGVIRPRGKRGGIGVAPVARGDDIGFLLHLFAHGQFDVRSYADWRAMTWSKLMLNMLANAIPAILDLPLDQAYADRIVYNLEWAAMREARAVAERMRIKLVSLPGYPVPLLVWLLCTWPTVLTYPLFRRVILGGRMGKPPSLHIDLARGRSRSEVAFLNGAVVRAGERLGVPTPVNQALYEILSGIARGEMAWDEYRGQPGELVRSVLGTGAPG